MRFTVQAYLFWMVPQDLGVVEFAQKCWFLLKLLDLEEGGSIQNSFENSESIVSELNAMKGEIDKMIDNDNRHSGISDLILWYFHWELISLIHPSDQYFCQ